MKALSIKQPWAWLIIRPDVTDVEARAKLELEGLIKDVENRNWPTRYRGWFYVHASKSFDVEGYEYVQRHFPDIEMPKPNQFEMGGIIGKVKLLNCVEDDGVDGPLPDDPDDWNVENDPRISEWFFGEYGFSLGNATPLPFRPLRGQLGFFEVATP